MVCILTDALVFQGVVGWNTHTSRVTGNDTTHTLHNTQNIYGKCVYVGGGGEGGEEGGRGSEGGG